jgi:hypothetical protein
MSSTSKLKGPPGDASRIAAEALAYLDRIGLLAFLEHGVARLISQSPLPPTAMAAWELLSAEITLAIKGLDGGGAKDVAGAMVSVFFKEMVRVRLPF